MRYAQRGICCRVWIWYRGLPFRMVPDRAHDAAIDGIFQSLRHTSILRKLARSSCPACVRPSLRTYSKGVLDVKSDVLVGATSLTTLILARNSGRLRSLVKGESGSKRSAKTLLQ